MPALPNVPNVIRLEHHWTVAEDLYAKCRQFWSYSGSAPTNAMLNTLCASVVTAYAADWKGAFCTDRVLTQIKATDLTSPTAGVGFSTAAVAGTDTGIPMDAGACLVMAGEVARRFRGGHSRVYWPAGGTDDMQDAQTWKSSWLAGIVTAYTTYQAAIAALTWAGGGLTQPVNVSYYSGFTVHTGVTGRARNVSTPRAVPVIDVINQNVFRTGIGSQRKRLLRLA